MVSLEEFYHVSLLPPCPLAGCDPSAGLRCCPQAPPIQWFVKYSLKLDRFEVVLRTCRGRLVISEGEWAA